MLNIIICIRIIDILNQFVLSLKYNDAMPNTILINNKKNNISKEKVLQIQFIILH